MRIVADHNIPLVAQAFSDLGEVELMHGREITADQLKDCQCLVIRTVTRVDATLLDNTAVEFVATATIGTDHVDKDYLNRAGIGFSNAPGCNAEGAAEYVVSGLFEMSRRRDFDPFALKAGIVGFGNVGSRLYAKLEALGIECLLCDPPLQQSGRSRHSFVDLDIILAECDFISLHVPLTHDGEHPTYHLLDENRLRRLVDGCVLINAARGEVIDNRALLELLNDRSDLRMYLDTWENEPLVSRPLLQRVDLATPHIAGYSVEGRLRGTQMSLDAACAHFDTTQEWHMSRHLPPTRVIDCSEFGEGTEFWRDLLKCHCNIAVDHVAFVDGSALDDAAFAAHFDGLRRIYPDRLEYDRFSLRVDASRQPVEQLARLGFRLET